ncbi:cinnamoyl-Coa reductase [Stylosanthes scabra]|uniref:Cinnamoyl-Coa reductase n=1 Tax=Stylosanthes scabra TaxID=79078 RepID=A0ABU6WNB0_9FABA|nr:cinnamoyl-Coa reductase [Stylosanthes scabra]
MNEFLPHFEDGRVKLLIVVCQCFKADRMIRIDLLQCWAARDTSGYLSPFHFTRRENEADDVTLKILYCGVCHTDLHTIKNEWGVTNYPVVPGHEIVGVVTKVGSNVTKFMKGDRVGVGVMVDSCKECECCQHDMENHCPQHIFTYNSPHKGTTTRGGYSDFVVVHQRYVLHFPYNLPLDAGAPLLCAGITVHSPMMYYGMTEPGKHFGVAGLGGLGHVAIKFGKAFGLKVTVISSSPSKESEAIDVLGADSFLLSSDPEKMKAATGTMDYIIDTISAVHPLGPLLDLLKVNGKLAFVALPGDPLQLPVFPLVGRRKFIGGSYFGGIKETQDMLDFCGKHNITANIELIKMDEINTAVERLSKADVKYRFVIDIQNPYPRVTFRRSFFQHFHVSTLLSQVSQYFVDVE